METGVKTLYKDKVYNKEMVEVGFGALNRLRTFVQTFKHYGNLVVDVFSDSNGIASGTNYTYEGSPNYDVKLTAGVIGNFVSIAFIFPISQSMLGAGLLLSADSTDVLIYLSRNNGTEFVLCPVTRLDVGLYRSTNMVEVANTTGAVKYRINFRNSTAVKVKGVVIFGR